MQYQSFVSDIEILGTALNATVAGFGPFKSIVENMLLRKGLASRRESGEIIVDPEGWYPQQAWLDTLREVEERFGCHVLFKIGSAIPTNAVFPPFVVDIHSGLQSIDIAYHINHRRGGRVMFDQARGTMLDGIGNYAYTRVSDTRVEFCCHTPYPCRFDLGIVTAMAKRFIPDAWISHSGQCRSDGAEACNYGVCWNMSARVSI